MVALHFSPPSLLCREAQNHHLICPLITAPPWNPTCKTRSLASPSYQIHQTHQNRASFTQSPFTTRSLEPVLNHQPQFKPTKPQTLSMASPKQHPYRAQPQNCLLPFQTTSLWLQPSSPSSNSQFKIQPSKPVLTHSIHATKHNKTTTKPLPSPRNRARTDHHLIRSSTASTHREPRLCDEEKKTNSKIRRRREKR